MSRRAILRLTGAGAVLAAGLLLGACRGDGGDEGGGGENEGGMGSGNRGRRRN